MGQPAEKRRLLIINGSTRAGSTNARLITAIRTLVGERAAVTRYPTITDLPHFNPDLDVDPVPPTVAHLRDLIRATDAVLICTPEYAMGVPGSLKNAFDWCVSSSSLSGKPTLLITASLSGEKGHAALMDTLRVIEAVLVPAEGVLIPFAQSKVDKQGVITDAATLEAVTTALEALLHALPAAALG